MGRDNHPRERQARQLERKKPKRATYDRILVVSEGEKTEVNYLGEIRRQYRLSSAHICICQSDFGTTPERVVQYAVTRCQETSKWERVYCVIDRDDHDHYVNALTSAEAHDKKFVNDLGEPIRFTSIPSNPSFELWLLLHFQDSEAFIHRDDVISALRGYIPGYSKGKTGTFAATMDHLAVACERTERLRGREARRGMTNPCTHVDELVEALRTLRANL